MSGDRRRQCPPRQTGSAVRPVVASLVVIAVAIALWFWMDERRREPVEQTVTTAPPPKAPEVETEPLIRHPIPEPGSGAAASGEAAVSELADVLPDPLPKLERSDDALLAIAERLLDSPRLIELLVSEHLVRRFVISVDALGMRSVPPQHRPVSPPAGKFQVEKAAGQLVIDPRNYSRYRRHVEFVEQLDSRAVVEAYIHLYPLFQQAYQELGYPGRSFNDRLIAVIDEILATPEVTRPVRLEHPSVYYLYAEPEIEALSAGQRLLIRMGPDNGETVKNKLRAIKGELAR